MPETRRAIRLGAAADAALVGCVRIRQLDVDKRLTATQVKQNAWVLKDAKSDVLDTVGKQLKSYQAKQRLKKAAMGVIFQKRMEKALADLRAGQAADAPVEVS